MFTGLIEEKGTVRNAGGGTITVTACKVLQGTKIGDSIAVNGVCLTVVNMNSDSFSAHVMPETLRRTNLGQSAGTKVNLERAMPANGRFGGHIVSGHIDGTGVLESKRNEGNAVWYRIRCARNLSKYIVEKGSVALDGISLTVAAAGSAGSTNAWFEVSVIPHTEDGTNLPDKRIGDLVNIETDIIGKYVEHMLSDTHEEAEETNKITMDFLREMEI